MKIISTIACFLLLFHLTSSTHLNCSYEHQNWTIIGEIYLCNVQNELDITSPQTAQITEVCGTLDSGKDNSSIAGFHAYEKVIQYFPRGLEKIYTNIKAVRICKCNLNEIHQTDLKPFPQLTFLDLSENNIKVLEKELFDYNPDLSLVWFNKNKIFHIDANVFDNLGKSTDLQLSSNVCIDMSTSINATAVWEIIIETKIKCQDEKYLVLESVLNAS